MSRLLLTPLVSDWKTPTLPTVRVASLGTQKPLGYSWEFQSVPHLILGHVDFQLDRNVTYVDGTKVDPLAPSPSGNCASRDCVPSKLVIAKKKEKKTICSWSSQLMYLSTLLCARCYIIKSVAKYILGCIWSYLCFLYETQ